MSTPSFKGVHLKDTLLHFKNLKFFIATKKLPARTAVGVLQANAERNMAEISNFSSTLQGSAVYGSTH